MKLTNIKNFPFGVKGLKTYRGHEGEPLSQATLTYQGKAIGFVGEGDWGGPATLTVDTAYEAIVNQYIKSQPQWSIELTGGKVITGEYDDDTFVADVIEVGTVLKQIKALNKKGTYCFVLPTDAEGEFRTVKTGDEAKAKQWLANKYPDAVILEV